MKKWMKIGLVCVALAVGGIAASAWYQSHANDSALEEIKSESEVVVLAVSGMT